MKDLKDLLSEIFGDADVLVMPLEQVYDRLIPGFREFQASALQNGLFINHQEAIALLSVFLGAIYVSGEREEKLLTHGCEMAFLLGWYLRGIKHEDLG